MGIFEVKKRICTVPDIVEVVNLELKILHKIVTLSAKLKLVNQGPKIEFTEEKTGGKSRSADILPICPC